MTSTQHKKEENMNPYSPDILFKMFAETDKKFAETKEMFAETDRKFAETERRSLKTDKKFDQLQEHLQGMSKSQSLDAEEFFLSSLKKHPYLGDVKFDIVSPQSTKEKGADSYQMDIFLENGNSVGIIEVKNKARKENIDQLEKLVSRFETFYTTHAGMKKYAAIAAKIIPKHVEELALKKGFFVLKQQGNHVEVSSPFKNK